MTWQTPQVTPHYRLLAQRNDELYKLAATYREVLQDVLASLDEAWHDPDHTTTCNRIVGLARRVEEVLS